MLTRKGGPSVLCRNPNAFRGDPTAAAATKLAFQVILVKVEHLLVLITRHGCPVLLFLVLISEPSCLVTRH